MESNRSVVDHLEGIEDSLSEINKLDLPLSEQIGEPFDEYLKNSEVYYYEPDNRRFEKYKKGQIKKLLIFLFLYIIPIIFHIFMNVCLCDLSCFSFIADIIFILPTVIYLIYTVKVKNKKLAVSKWNVVNHHFYTYDKFLGEDESNGTFKNIMIVFKIICFATSVLLQLIDIIKFDAQLFDNIIFLIYFGFSLGLSPFYFFLNYYKEYFYDTYILEQKASYVIYSRGKCKKINK